MNILYITLLNDEVLILTYIMSATSAQEIDEHASLVLNGIREKLLVTDLIKDMDIADGVKELLISSGFTLKSLINASASEFADILGIDRYVAKIISDAVNKTKETPATMP
jgi:hypothetical protein